MSKGNGLQKEETLRTVFLPIETDRGLTTVARHMRRGRETLMREAISNYVRTHLDRVRGPEAS